MFSAVAVVQEMEQQMIEKDAFLDWMIAKWRCDIGSPESRNLLEIADRVLELNLTEHGANHLFSSGPVSSICPATCCSKF